MDVESQEKGSADLDAEADPEAVARAIVLRQLTASAKSRKQLADKLAQRKVPVEAAEAVLDRFEAAKLIDDAEFARSWVRSRAEHRSLARSVLRRELQEKGIAAELTEAALEQLDDSTERAAAVALVRRKLRSGNGTGAGAGAAIADRAERDKVLRRLVSMLARKGYAPGLAFAVANEELSGIEETDR